MCYRNDRTLHEELYKATIVMGAKNSTATVALRKHSETYKKQPQVKIYHSNY